MVVNGKVRIRYRHHLTIKVIRVEGTLGAKDTGSVDSDAREKDSGWGDAGLDTVGVMLSNAGMDLVGVMLNPKNCADA